MELFDIVAKNRFGDEELKTIKKIPGDCFEILEKNPDLKGRVDVILVKNLEHFFNPIQHQLFLKLIADLLAPGGKAFLLSHSISPYPAEHPLMKAFLLGRKNNTIYPGFLKCEFTFNQSMECQGIMDKKISKVEAPKEEEACYTKTLNKKSLGKFFHSEIGKPSEIFEVTQEVIAIHFDPLTYKNALSKHKSLQLDASFFIDREGYKQEKFSKNSDSCGAIITKKNES